MKLGWIFKIYDIGNLIYLKFISRLTIINNLVNIYFKDGNGMIEKSELKLIVTSIYKLLYNDSFTGNTLTKFAEDHARDIFIKFDIDRNQKITLNEFIEGCKSDSNLLKLLCPSI